MKKYFFLTVVLLSVFALSGCNTNAGELLNQAFQSNLEVVTSDKESDVVSEAPVKSVSISGYGKVMTNQNYRPLYVKNEDTSSQSTCYEECAIAWPPLLVDSEDEVSGDYGVITRTDGTLQVTYLGKPLYSYTPDTARRVTGDGYRGVWKVVVLEKEAEEVEE